MFQSTKTFGHEVGLSCAFRQWRAKSHCRFIHGYPLSFKFTFACKDTDENGWVVDFGRCKELLEKLREVFDHRLLVADDDPELEKILSLHHAGVASVLVFPGGVGCERFARHASMMANAWLVNNAKLFPRVWLASVEVCEHGGNSAIYLPEDKP